MVKAPQVIHPSRREFITVMAASAAVIATGTAIANPHAKFQTAFPDFPVADMPNIPAGFEDISWHLDDMPSFESASLGLPLFVDFADKAKREWPDGTRFILVSNAGRHGALLTDDWAEVVDLIGRLAATA